SRSFSVMCCALASNSFSFINTAPTDTYTLSLHDALPICNGNAGPAVRHRERQRPSDPLYRELDRRAGGGMMRRVAQQIAQDAERSEEHTSELQPRGHLVCRLPLEKKNITATWRRS